MSVGDDVGWMLIGFGVYVLYVGSFNMFSYLVMFSDCWMQCMYMLWWFISDIVSIVF